MEVFLVGQTGQTAMKLVSLGLEFEPGIVPIPLLSMVENARSILLRGRSVTRNHVMVSFFDVSQLQFIKIHLP